MNFCFLIEESERGIFDAILRGYIDFESDPWPSISSSAKDLVRKMLTQDPKIRITAAQVLGMHKFLAIISMHIHVRNYLLIQYI